MGGIWSKLDDETREKAIIEGAQFAYKHPKTTCTLGAGAAAYHYYPTNERSVRGRFGDQD